VFVGVFKTVMYKNDRVTSRYSKPFKLKILSELSPGTYSNYEPGP
jgi:hypothetical protein